MPTTQVSTAVRDEFCETATPTARRRVTDVADVAGVAVHVRGALLDEEILAHVDNVLKWNFDCPVALKATICDGAITLHGVVDWSYQRTVAARVVRQVFGVRSVTNQIRSCHTAL